MQTALVLITLLSLAACIVISVLLRRSQSPLVNRTILQLSDQLVRLETLQNQLMSTLREGFRDSRGETITALNDIRGAIYDNLEKIRAETANLRIHVLDQLNSLTTGLFDRLSGTGLSISGNIQDFTDTVSGKLEGTTSSIRSDIQTQIGGMQTNLIASFGELRQAVADALNHSEQKQTANGAALQDAIDKSFTRLSSQLKDSLETHDRQLSELTRKTDSSLAEVKESVQQQLTNIAGMNENKLEQMRQTVDEKLHSTLEKRLADSFGIVSDQLGKVQTGLGEMKDLASNVGDLKKVLTNVKSRGGFAEVQLGAQLNNILAPSQYKANVRVKPDTTESVEYAVCLPGSNGSEECLLPIDAKFPKDVWERLESAREAANLEEIKRASSLFETAIKTEAKRISEKYINPPATTNFAYMYLPTEALFSEVVKSPTLLDEIQTKYRVSVAGPTTLMALLISFQMGFQTLAIQKKGTEVWNVLAAAKLQFGKFGDLMTTVERKVGSVQKSLQEIGTRTRVINRTLSGVDTVAIESTTATELLSLSSQTLGDPDDREGVADGAAAGK